MAAKKIISPRRKNNIVPVQAYPHELSQRISDLGAIRDLPMSAMSTYFEWVKTYTLPASEAEANELTGSIQLLQDDNNDPNVITNGMFQFRSCEWFIATGVALVMQGDREQGAITGGIAPRSTVASVDGACVPPVEECVDATGPWSPAVLNSGSPTQTVIENMLFSHRFKILLQNRFLWLDALLCDVGVVACPPTSEGAGSRFAPYQQDIRLFNDRTAEKDIDLVFSAQNATDIDGSLACVPPPFQYKQSAHLNTRGLNRVKKLPCGMLLGPNVCIEMELESNGDPHAERAIRDAVTITRQTPYAGAGDCVGAEGSPIYSSVTTAPVGTLRIGVVLYGYTLVPKCVLEYLQMGVGLAGPKFADVYSGIPELGQLILRNREHLGASYSKLAGLLEPKNG